MVETRKHKTILVVDDSALKVELFRTIFQLNGHDVHTAYDTKGALDILRTQPIGQLWIDNRMPEETGIEFTRRLRQNPVEYPFVRRMGIVLISETAKEDLAEEDRVLFDAFLPSSFDNQEIANLAMRL